MEEERHVIVGAGPVGTAIANLLAARGERVRVITRSGRGPVHPNVELVAADATDSSRLVELTVGATVLYNCANPPYHRWLTDWPPLAESLLVAAERSGAVLATAGNLYGYGPVDGPITATTPLTATHPKLKIRADMWREALARQEAGRIRVTEVRASDYLEANSLLAIMAKTLRTGKLTAVPAKLNVPHSFTAIADVARTLTTVAADERGWGKAWLVPSHPAMTIRELADRFCAVTGSPAPKLVSIPYPVLWTAGLFNPLVRELRATHYQFVRPFVLDASETERTFGIRPSDLDTAIAAAAGSGRDLTDVLGQK